MKVMRKTSSVGDLPVGSVSPSCARVGFMAGNPNAQTKLVTICSIGLLLAVGTNLSAGEYYDLGRPVIGAWQRTAWLVHDPVLKRDILWSQECSQDGGVFYGIDLQTGEILDEHDVPAREVGGVLEADDGVLYLYTYSGLTHPGNELLRFDPRKREIERMGLAPTPRNRCVGGTIGPDGHVFIGTHQQGRLFRFDTRRREWADLGQMVPTPVRPNQNTWLKNLQFTSDGRLLGTVVRTPPPEVVEINIADRSFRKVNAIHSQDFVVHGENILDPRPNGFDVFDREYNKVREITLESLSGPSMDWREKPSIALVNAGPQLGIIARINRLLVRIDLTSDTWKPLANLPFEGSLCFLRDGRWAACVDHPQKRYAAIDLKSGQVSVHRISYKGKRGTQICGLNRGLDGAIYGTNIIGMHVFRCDTATDEITDLGHVGWSGGEVYNTIQVDHRVFLGTYGGGHWGVYDTRQPWRPDFAGQGKTEDANPRRIAQLGGEDPNAANRPFEYVLGPSNRVYVACRANYGYPGGSLIEFDPKTGSMKVFRDRQRSVQSVAADGRYVFGGTSIHGGRGSGDRANEAVLFVFDPQAGKRVFEDEVVSGAKAVVSVRHNPADQRIYATTDNQVLLRFHPRSFKVEKTWKLRQAGTPVAGVPEDVGMLHITAAHDGNIYGVAFRDLYRLNTSTDELEYLETPPRSGLYQIVEGRPGEFYMGCGTHLLKYVVEPSSYFR